MTRTKLNIDSDSIMKSINVIIDRIKNRKEYRNLNTKVLYIDSNNTNIQFYDKIPDKGTVTIKESTHTLNKRYTYLKGKKLIDFVIIYEKSLDTIDLKNFNIVNETEPELLKKFLGIKLMDEFHDFNMGQVILGTLFGIIIGYVGNIVLLNVW